MIQLIINHLNCRSCTYVNISVNIQMMLSKIMTELPVNAIVALAGASFVAPPSLVSASLSLSLAAMQAPAPLFGECSKSLSFK